MICDVFKEGCFWRISIKWMHFSKGKKNLFPQRRYEQVGSRNTYVGVQTSDLAIANSSRTKTNFPTHKCYMISNLESFSNSNTQTLGFVLIKHHTTIRQQSRIIEQKQHTNCKFCSEQTFHDPTTHSDAHRSRRKLPRENEIRG